MIEFSEEGKSAQSNKTCEELFEIIKKLPEHQQEYLLGVLQNWTKDTREYPRVECQADVLYSDNTRCTQGMVMNISASGLYLQPDSPFEVGSDITLSFEHPFTKKQLRIKGKIVRGDTKGIAVRFEQTIGSIL